MKNVFFISLVHVKLKKKGKKKEATIVYGSSSRRENIKLHEICSISIFNLLNVSYEWWQYRFARERHLQSFFSLVFVGCN